MNIFLIFSLFFLSSQADTEKDKTVQHISILACAAISKRLSEVPSENAKFIKLVQQFSEKINYEEEQTRNFVNLLLLNNCYSKITFMEAGEIIKERAETKNVSTKHIKYLNVEGSFANYETLNNDEKKNLFIELGEIKELLKGLSESIGDISKGDYSKFTDTKSKNKDLIDKKARDNKEKKTNSEKDEDEEIGFFTLILKTMIIIFASIVGLVYEYSYLFLIGFALVILVNLAGTKRLRKKKKEQVKNE